MGQYQRTTMTSHIWFLSDRNVSDFTCYLSSITLLCPLHISSNCKRSKKSSFDKCFIRLVEFMHCHRAKSNQFVVFWLHFDRKVNLQIWSNDVIPQNLRRLYPLITSWNLSIAWPYLWHYRPTSIISSPGVTILHYLWQINTQFPSLTRRLSEK